MSKPVLFGAMSNIILHPLPMDVKYFVTNVVTELTGGGLGSQNQICSLSTISQCDAHHRTPYGLPSGGPQFIPFAPQFGYGITPCSLPIHCTCDILVSPKFSHE
eukprot:840123_1